MVVISFHSEEINFGNWSTHHFLGFVDRRSFVIFVDHIEIHNIVLVKEVLFRFGDGFGVTFILEIMVGYIPVVSVVIFI